MVGELIRKNVNAFETVVGVELLNSNQPIVIHDSNDILQNTQWWIARCMNQRI